MHIIAATYSGQTLKAMEALRCVCPAEDYPDLHILTPDTGVTGPRHGLQCLNDTEVFDMVN